MPKIELSVIIPGYNEEKIIVNTINSVEKIIRSFKKSFEILIVDDGSNDTTSKILQRLVKSKKHPNLRFVSYKDGPSRRENLAKSFKLLNGRYVILLDMDLSMDLKHLSKMIFWLEHGYGMVIPNRYHKKSNIKRDPGRYIISKMYNAFIRMLFRTGFKDNICGFKAFKREVILQIIREAGIDESRRRSVFWDTEIIIHALRKGIRIKEIPIHWKEGKSSALTFKKEIKMIPYIIKFWMKSSKT
ncbi:glycosyltransferase [Candidatus Woesearchaeota archaeon]|nr:glycosyltransferase [Candidatus Woesearchaeota archaeon]